MIQDGAVAPPRHEGVNPEIQDGRRMSALVRIPDLTSKVAALPKWANR
jgi:hypothetical protein